MVRDSWSLAELAAEAGIPARTIRYYISRGLLDGPVVAGRAAHYTAAHLERLRRIQRMQTRGMMLAEIAHALARRPSNRLPEPVAWQSYTLSGDLVVMVRADAAPWRLKQIRNALEEFASKLGQGATEHAGRTDRDEI